MATAVAVKDEKKKRSIAITMGKIKEAEVARQHLVCDAPEGTTIEDLTETSFWALVSYKLRPFSRLEIRAYDGSWLVDAIVLMCDKTWAKVKILNEYDLTPKGTTLQDMAQEVGAVNKKHEPKFKGPGKGWCVVRISDKAVVKEKLETKVQAENWIREHEKAF